jgi:hypothetical protein
MDSETHSISPQRVNFSPLKPKRRSKLDETHAGYQPVLLNAKLELKRERARIRRSGHMNVQWRRVTPPSEISEILPARSHSPVLARVVDKVKAPRSRQDNHHGFWGLLRYWVLAFR